MGNFITLKDLTKVWIGMGKGTKILFIILALVVLVTMGIVINKDGLEHMEDEMQTESCQIAFEYLMNTYEIQEKYGSNEFPKLRGVHRDDFAGETPHHIKYLFVFHPLPFSNIGDQYTVELRYEVDEWVVIQVQKGSHMS